MASTPTENPPTVQAPAEPKPTAESPPLVLRVDNATLSAIWAKISLQQVMKSQPASFITVDSKMKLIDTCQTLIQHKISSVPVRDASKGDQIIGMFDWRDLSAGIVTAWSSRPSTELEEIKLFSDLMQYVPTLAVADISMHNHFYSLNEQQSMIDALQYFGQGVHRVTIVDKQNQPIGLLSQSDALKALHPLLSTELKQLGSRTLTELGIISRPPVTVRPTDRVIDALALMNKHHISSVGVVDPADKRLMGNLSVADMQYLFSSSHFGMLGRSVKQFLTEIFRAKDIEAGHKSQAVLFGAQADDTLSRCVDRLVNLRSHRLWVITKTHEPIGMVSLTDILGVVTPQMKLHNLIHAPQA